VAVVDLAVGVGAGAEVVAAEDSAAEADLVDLVEAVPAGAVPAAVGKARMQ